MNLSPISESAARKGGIRGKRSGFGVLTGSFEPVDPSRNERAAVVIAHSIRERLLQGLALSRELCCLLVLLGMATAHAFPPAPDHILFGTVRDQIGNPIDFNGAEIHLETAAGASLTTPVVPQLEPGMNYRLSIPMDAGLTADKYQPTALLPAAPFKLSVRVGGATYLPMEMAGNLARIGLPGGRTRLDLTLGVDADGNGLPDAWEKSVAAQLGRAWQPGQIRPNDVYPGSGMTYRAVYLAGTYSVAPTEGFAIQISRDDAGKPRLAFTAVKGRSYTLQAAERLGEWKTVPLRLLSSGPDDPTQEEYQATETRRTEIAVPPVDGPATLFYRLLVR